MSGTVECIACSWQGQTTNTDASHCPECGGETEPVTELYRDDAKDAARYQWLRSRPHMMVLLATVGDGKRKGGFSNATLDDAIDKAMGTPLGEIDGR